MTIKIVKMDICMNSIQVKKKFEAPIQKVFDLLAKHTTYNVAFAPI